MARFFPYQECNNIIVFYLNVRHHCYQVFGITFFCNDYSRLVILKGSIDCLHRRGHCLLFFHNDDGTSVVVSRSANAYAHNMYLLGPLLSFPFHLLSIQAKLPEQFKLDVIRKKLGEVITPTSVVLLQELERFNKLIKRMALSLSNLQKVGQMVQSCDQSLSEREWTRAGRLGC